MKAAPALFADLAAAAPARVVKKLDADRGIARSWTWSDATVTTPGGEVVTLQVADGIASAVTCSCLLSPRCFHALAVAAVLEIAPADGPDAPAAEAPPLPSTVALDASARAAAQRARVVAADILAAGASGTGTLLEVELLRVVHLARVAGLHRLAGAGLRVVQNVRALAASSDAFDAGILVEDLRELVTTAHRLDQAEVPGDAIGVARRAYEGMGHLRLVGVASEPVVARGGYGGIVTHVLDDGGGLWSIGDVMPGGEDRARGAYDLSLAMGDTTISHRALSRGGLFVQDATGSSDRRLGAGKDVKAVRASGDLGWAAPAIRARFDEPLAAQIARSYEALALPPERIARGASLLFARGIVIGHDDTAVLLRSERPNNVLRLMARPGSLATFENLRQLAGGEGLGLEVVAHLVPEAPRTLGLIAFGPWNPVEPSDGAAPPNPRLVLPPEWRGVVNAGYDVVQRAHLDGATASDTTFESPVASFDPLSTLRRHVERVALHGTRSLPPAAMGAIDVERTALAKLLLPGAADALGHLAGARGRPAFRDAWLAGATYARTASIALWRAGW